MNVSENACAWVDCCSCIELSVILLCFIPDADSEPVDFCPAFLSRIHIYWYFGIQPAK